MLKTAKRISAIGIATATSTCLVFTGMASAQSSINLTGPGSLNEIITSSSSNNIVRNNNQVRVGNNNRQYALTGNASVRGNTYGGGYGSNWRNSMPWSDMNPQVWQGNGQSFGGWWNAMMQHMARYNANGWGGNGSNTSWMPSGGNWEDNWSNWNPSIWQSNNQSYSNWYQRCLGYLSGQYNNWKNNWHNGGNSYGGGNASSGYASNNANSYTSVGITNGGHGGNGYGSTNGQSGNATIHLTGPHSTNIIREASNTNYQATNNNDVSVNNNNNQRAISGNANVSDNTIGGNAQTGAAMNTADNRTNITLANSTGNLSNWTLGNGSNTNGYIGITGPNSRNIISSSDRRNVSETNNNNVRINNNTNQNAMSGNATVRDNTIGGGASTGDASNAAATDTTVAISNR